MSTIGIIGAMQVELATILEVITTLEKRQIAGFDFTVGEYAGNKVVVTRCSIGKVNAATCTQLLIDHFGVGAIINTGVAGSMNPHVRFADVVIGDRLTYHDVRPKQMVNHFPFKEHFTASTKLVALAKAAVQEVLTGDYAYHVGKIVTGEQFVTDRQLKQSIVEAYAPLCVEMEGAAIAHVAELNGIDFVVIRSISDHADDSANVDYDTFEALAAERSAKLVLTMLKHAAKDNS